MMTRSRTLLGLRLLTLVTLVMIGCATHSKSLTATTTPSTTQTATDIDPATTQPSYWYAMPAVASAEADDFQTLWETCKDVARSYFFKIDRMDYRAGVLTTEPLVSAQFFEPWRRDVETIDDATESSLATIRRTIRFEITHDGDRWRATPKVLIERRTIAERRITSVVLYRNAFKNVRGNKRDLPSGTRESDVGVYLASRYWYAIGRDETFERSIAERLQSHLNKLVNK
jgi:hypothetical protein